MSVPEDHKTRPQVAVLIPALNEAEGLAQVLTRIPKQLVQCIVVADNGSTDRTSEVAQTNGAQVVFEPERGYGAACQSACSALPSQIQYLVFLDADNSDRPEQLPALLQPLFDGDADLVIGSRVLGQAERWALMPQQRFGNWLATQLIARLTGVRFTDLGPFRAITREAFDALKMQDRRFGWTVEMQLKAAQLGLRCLEVPVDYRRRIGHSKISGTMLGSLKAGYWILTTLWRYRKWSGP